MRYPIVCIKSSGKELSAYYYNSDIIENTMYYTSIKNLYQDWLEVIHVSDDKGNYIGLYDKKLFVTLAEWRDKQIENILNEN